MRILVVVLSIYVPAVINCGKKRQLENAIQVIIANAQKNLVQSCITGVKSVDNTGSINSETIDNDNDDGWCEVDERPSGVTDTLLQQPEVAGNGDNIISFAPGEGNKPLGIFMDKDSEFLSFPTIFCGKRRADNKKRKVPVSIVQ